MSLDQDLLSILCCPETKQPLTLADAMVIQKLNEAISRGIIRNSGEKQVTTPLDGGLIRADQQVLYPIRENIPVMLIEEGIPLRQVN